MQENDYTTKQMVLDIAMRFYETRYPGQQSKCENEDKQMLYSCIRDAHEMIEIIFDIKKEKEQAKITYDHLN
ncbi:hypothetical protein SAMN05421693_1355 [Ectothiorhodospira magna]|uniref:Uncharacterized protein n=1 Tax=Ectothiorhodospira magna TaxID=867345 RepID=A0A1H9GC73_9GAMM|nr:hypothetical protein [Ectothiorhodospira magna]SEQ47679.1 hypothetical protein SAMN05421693_1355 [Ectothiorhodospira magna]